MICEYALTNVRPEKGGNNNHVVSVICFIHVPNLPYRRLNVNLKVTGRVFCVKALPIWDVGQLRDWIWWREMFGKWMS